MWAALLLAGQVAAVPPGEPPARLRFAHMDGQVAVYLDEAFTRPDADRSGTTRTRSLRVPFDTEHEPYWITERHDCEGRRSQALWRESAIELMHDGRTDFSGSLQPWNDDASSAVGRMACGVTSAASPPPADLPLDQVIAEAYHLPLAIRFQPQRYEALGDRGETLDFLGVDADQVGWFVEPLSDRADGDGAIADVLAINGPLPASQERFVWFRLRFDCQGQVLVLEGQRYAEGPRHLEPVALTATAFPFEPGSMLARVQQYACTPDNPPTVQVAPGLNSAILGIVANASEPQASLSKD